MPPPPGPPDARSKLRRALGTGGLALCVLVALGVAALFLTLMGATKTGGAPEKHAPTQHLANQAGGPKPWAQAIGAIVSRRAASGAVNRRPTSRRSDTAHSPVTASSSGCSTTSLADRPETVIQLSARVTYVRATSDASAAYRNAHLAASLVAWCASVVPSDRVVATDQWPARIDRGVIGVPPFAIMFRPPGMSGQAGTLSRKDPTVPPVPRGRAHAAPLAIGRAWDCEDALRRAGRAAERRPQR
jgi:hypothetical protein